LYKKVKINKKYQNEKIKNKLYARNYKCLAG